MVYSITNENGDKFTFDNAWITSYTPSIDMNNKDGNVMPSGGPMQNQNYDYGGVTKIITLSGEIFDVSSSVVVDSGDVTIAGFDNILNIKYWLESLISGIQSTKSFVSPLDQYSLSSSGGTTTINGAAIPGAWVATKVYVIKLEFPDSEEFVGNKLQFNITLEVAGF